MPWIAIVAPVCPALKVWLPRTLETAKVPPHSRYLTQLSFLQVGYTHHTSVAPRFAGDVRSFWADLGASGGGSGGLQEAFDSLGRVDVVINTAALSAPAACHRDPDAARCVGLGYRDQTFRFKGIEFEFPVPAACLKEVQPGAGGTDLGDGVLN